MKIYYYVHTGHRIGLDRFRRAVAIINSLGDVNITLLCSDFRIAQVAKDFGIKSSVGVDVVRNIPQIALHGDKLIFDSEEANPIMLDDMRNYFSTFIRISDHENDKKEEKEFLISPYLHGEGICNAYAIHDTFFQEEEMKNIKISFFFGDDDYEKDIEKYVSLIEDLNADLQLGFYYFLDYEESLKKRFPNHYEFDAYEEMIKKSEILLTASPQAVLESLACGGKPIYFQREDYSTNFNELFKNLNVPVVENLDVNQLSQVLQTISKQNYVKPTQYGNKIANFIKETLAL
ncbi:MAG: hypothetical protein Q7S59_02860 [Sulfurimonas sp.]|nr:hypothetical protein [Sulfurimonas sp.]